ncbi:hypothetical protein GW17_00060662 [Ensete ventricosum]|nr:hypothetical protein GW17_00060662 [Ensete ventricosum]
MDPRPISSFLHLSSQARFASSTSVDAMAFASASPLSANPFKPLYPSPPRPSPRFSASPVVCQTSGESSSASLLYRILSSTWCARLLDPPPGAFGRAQEMASGRLDGTGRRCGRLQRRRVGRPQQVRSGDPGGVRDRLRRSIWFRRSQVTNESWCFLVPSICNTVFFYSYVMLVLILMCRKAVHVNENYR